MAQFLKLVAVGFVTIIVLDFIWLGFITQKFYLENLSSIGRINEGKFQPVFWAAGFVYLFLAIAIVYFVLPKVEGASYPVIFFTGALLGLLTYGVYDMTNFSTLKEFPLQLAIADMVWGAVVCGLATLATACVRDL